MNVKPMDWTIWLRQQRHRAVRIQLGVILLLGFLGVAVSVWRWWAAGFSYTFNLPIYIVAYIIVILLAVLPSVRDEWRARGFIIILYGFGVFSLYSGWLVSGGRQFLLALTVVATILAKPRAGIITAVASIVTYIAFAVAFGQKWLVLRELPDPTSASPMIIEGIGFAMTIVMTATSLWFFGKALRAANEANQEALEARTLLAERAQDLETANRLLSTSIASFHNIVERSADGILVMDQQGIVRFANQAAGSFFDRLPDQLAGAPSPFALAAIQDTALEILGAGASRQVVEVRVVETEWEGQPAYLALLHDITERRQAEEALQESEARWKFALEGSGDGVWDWNAQTNYVYFSRQWKAMLGFEEHEIGNALAEWDTRIHPDDREYTYEEIRKHLEGKSPLYISEHRVQCKDGTYKWILNRGQVIEWTEAGKPLRVIGTHSDITARKRAESEREALIAELEAKNTELERFTYTVSHDLKSPLITIGGFVGFLERDALLGDIDRVKVDVNHINDALARMQLLLDELLSLSRIGRQMNPPEAVPFSDIANEAIALVHGRIAAHNVTVDIAPGLPIVYGDRARLIEVMQNLVDNACKFVRTQLQPRIEIGVRTSEAEPVFYVRDNGIGIAPQYHNKVFGLFEKLDPQSEGTGVGLALVKRIIETHGGKIWVESEGNGKGCTFYFTLSKTDSQLHRRAR